VSKKLIVLLGRADWAGSCHSVREAINRIGEFECRHISLYPHIFGYPSDIVIPICFVPNPGSARDYPDRYADALELMEEADLIHLWNDILPAFNGLLPVPERKVKSYTFTGTLYRQGHKAINEYLRKMGGRVVVQNPTYRYLDEIESEFIPHAVNTDLLEPIPVDKRTPMTIGCYRPAHKSTTAREDISLLESILRENHRGWRITLDRMMSWQERMDLMPRCTYFFEYMDPSMGYWGRSALEACTVGVPTFSYISTAATDLSQGRLGEPPIIHITRDNLKTKLSDFLNIDRTEYEELSRRSREWAVKYYGYETIGELYTRFFRKISAVTPEKKLTLRALKSEAGMRSKSVSGQKVGRNDPCPCGSGRKYKKCCLLSPAVKQSEKSPVAD
jgi:hypothetical protein